MFVDRSAGSVPPSSATTRARPPPSASAAASANVTTARNVPGPRSADGWRSTRTGARTCRIRWPTADRSSRAPGVCTAESASEAPALHGSCDRELKEFRVTHGKAPSRPSGRRVLSDKHSELANRRASVDSRPTSISDPGRRIRAGATGLGATQPTARLRPHPFELGPRDLLRPRRITPAIESILSQHAEPALVPPHRGEISMVAQVQHFIAGRRRQRACITGTQIHLAHCPTIGTLLEVLPCILILRVRPKPHRHATILTRLPEPSRLA